MLFWIKIGQVVIAILLMVAILLQNRGTGVGGVFGGTGGVYLTKRGIEKITYRYHCFSGFICGLLFASFPL